MVYLLNHAPNSRRILVNANFVRFAKAQDFGNLPLRFRGSDKTANECDLKPRPEELLAESRRLCHVDMGGRGGAESKLNSWPQVRLQCVDDPAAGGG